MARRRRIVERKLVAEVCPSGVRFVVELKTAHESVGLFMIPDGKDPAEWMQRMGWTYVGRMDDLNGEVWGKIVSV